MKAWYESLFEEDYLRIYAHRDEQQAGEELRRFLPYLHITPGMNVLDLCCGQGRHARWLAHKGLRVTGVDLSTTLLREAEKRSKHLSITYIQSDVRMLPSLKPQDVVFNCFTSFGYFSEDSENERVFEQVCRVLKPGGFFFFDYFNPTYLRNHIVPYSRYEQFGLLIEQYREITDDFMKKRIVITEDGKQREYEEQIKLYEIEALLPMMSKHKLTCVHQFGEYSAVPYDREKSSRIILICSKKDCINTENV